MPKQSQEFSLAEGRINYCALGFAPNNPVPPTYRSHVECQTFAVWKKTVALVQRWFKLGRYAFYAVQASLREFSAKLTEFCDWPAFERNLSEVAD